MNNNLAKHKTEQNVFECEVDNKWSITILCIFTAIILLGAIRYFLLLSKHYAARADALLIIDREHKFSVEDAIGITANSAIDFWISRNLKNEFLEIYRGKVEKEKAAVTPKCCRINNCCLGCEKRNEPN